MNRKQLLDDISYLMSKLECCSIPDCEICQKHVKLINRFVVNLELTPDEISQIIPEHILTRIGHWE